MNFLTDPSEAASKLIRALKLPDTTISFTLKMRVGEPAKIVVESYVDQAVADDVALILKEYELEERVPKTRRRKP